MAWFCSSDFLRKFADNALGQFARWSFGTIGQVVDTNIDVHFDAVPTAEFVQDRFKCVFDQLHPVSPPLHNYAASLPSPGFYPALSRTHTPGTYTYLRSSTVCQR